CINFLFPFDREPDALAELLRPVFPTINKMLHMEEPGSYISIEWIGLQNYLGEKTGKKIPRHERRTRGANSTSADAAVMFEHDDGSRQIALIEWKYTESYSATPLKIAKSGTDRSRTYAPLYEREDCPIDRSLLNDFGDLFYEPFYQHMRQQLLAHEMERAQELGATTVSLLHIAPAHNTDFQRVTSPALRGLGDNVTGVWERLLNNSDRYATVATEELFGSFPIERFPQLQEWWDYLTKRYSWLR
ncbi:MAG: hypothetical protein IIC21_09490, partial [Chloroflexi bacterium]|nr:hypothetical protein [Chloroflexota bacterium]